MFKRLLLSLSILLLFINSAFASGGDLLCSRLDNVNTGYPISSAKDSAGNVIIAGYKNISLNDDAFYIAKFSADCSGILWSYEENPSSQSDRIVSVTTDFEDNVIVAGYFLHGTTVDIKIFKLDKSTGNKIWEERYNGSANLDDYPVSVKTDGLGNVYVAGYTRNSSGNDDFLLIKYPKNGGIPLWVQTFDSAYNRDDRVTTLDVSNDSVVVAGYSDNGNNLDMLVIKYDLSGVLVWSRRYIGDANDEDRAVAVKIDGNGDVILAGYLTNSSANKDIYVGKYLKDTGVPAWERIYNGGYDDEPNALTLDESGNIYITGNTWTIEHHTQVITLKLSPSDGTILWQKIYSIPEDVTTVGTDIVAETEGDIYVTGYLVRGTNYNILTIKYHKLSGNQIWAVEFDGTAQKNDRALNVFVGNDGKISLSGWSETATNEPHFILLKYEPGSINPPTNLTFNLISNTQVQLNWSDNSNNEDSFKIERKTGDLGSWQEIATVSANITTYTDSTVTANSKYYYRVRAYSNTEGFSHYSNEVKVITTVISFEQPSWVYTFNGTGNNDDYANAIAIGADGNPVVTGFSYSSNSGFDYVTMKLDRSNGSLIWSQTYDDPENDTDIATCVDVDNNNNVIVSGFASLFNPNVGYNTNDIMTIKYSSTGAYLWGDAFSGPGNNDDRSVAISVTKDSSGNPYVLGYGKNASGNDDIYLIKYSPAGTRLWSKIYNGGSDDYPSSFVIDKNGDVIVVGYVIKNGNFDWYVSKHSSSDGNVLWTYFYDEAGFEDRALSIASDKNDDVLVTGFITTTGGIKDIQTLKLSGSNGSLIWQKKLNRTAGENQGKKVLLDPVDGEVVVAGTVTNIEGDRDVYIAKFKNTDGSLIWEKTVSRLSINDNLADAVIDISGNVCLGANTGSYDSQDVMAVKFDHEGNLLGASLYNGVANRQDGVEKIAVNRFGETFLAGYTTTSNGDTDILIFKCGLDPIQVPTPITLIPSYNSVVINWSDNSFSETGYLIERKAGSCSETGLFETVATTSANVTTYTDNNLPTDTTFCYRVRTVGANNFTSREGVQVETKTLKPQPPTLTSLQALNTTTVKLNWTDNTTEETGFGIERCPGVNCEDFEFLTNVPSNTTTYNDTSACNGSTYRYRIYAFKTGYWTTEYSQVLTVTLPAPPSSFSLTATALSESSIKIDWTDAFSDETGFIIERCEGASCENFSQINSVSANTTSFTDNTVLWGKTYRYRIKAYKNATCSWYVYSNTASATTDVMAPASLSASELKTTSLKLTWQDKTSTESGFKIYRCLGDTCGNFQVVATLGANTTTYTDATVCEGTIYRYYVTAYKTGEWESQPSNIIQVTTNSKGSFVSFNAQRLSEMEATLSFSFNSSDLDGFKIERCDSNTCSESDFNLIKTLASGYNSYTEIVNADSYYTYRVKAYKASSCGWEVATTPVTVFTESYPPSGVTATPQNSTTVNLNWIDNTKFESDFSIERCEGSDCSNFTKIGTVDNNAVQYTDTSVCASSSYKYRVKAEYNNFKNSGGGCWKRRSKLNITNFAENTAIKVNITYKTGMKPDFSDIRFLDDTKGVELPYWIESKTDSSNALVWLKTGNNNNIYMYYDNMLATAPNYSGKDVFEFFEGFDSTSIDTSIWNVDTTNYSLSNGVLRINQGAMRTKNPLPFNLNDGYILEGKIIYYNDESYVYSGTLTGVSSTYTASGNSTASATVLLMRNSNYSPYNRDLYYFTGDGSQSSYNQGTAYLFRTDTNVWYIFSEKYLPTGLVISNNYSNIMTKSFSWTKSPRYITIGEFSGNSSGNIQDTGYDWVRVRKYLATEPSVSIGTEEYNESCIPVNIPNQWEKISPEVSVTTPVPFTPAITATGVSEANIRIDITDSNIDETGFKIYRCAGVSCNPKTDGTLIGTAPANALSYLDTVTTGTYTYLVEVYKDANCGWSRESNTVSASTILPPAPSSLTATALSTTEIRLNWVDNTGTEDGFKIYKCIGSGCSDYVLLTTVPANTVTFTDNTLCKNTTAKYKVTAYKDGVWETDFSNEASATTQNITTTPSLTLTRVSEVSVKLDWTDTTADETGFKVERCNLTTCSDSDFSVAATLGSNVITYTDNVPETNKKYTYRIRAYKSASCSWDVLSLTKEITLTPTAPSSLTATVVNTTQINLSWADNTATEDGFKIYRCEGTGCNNYIVISAVGANVKNYNDTNVCRSTTYSYKVTAYKGTIWESDFSNIVTATTLTGSAPVLSATRVSETQINLSWTDGNNDETGFEVWRCAGSGCDPKTGTMIPLGANTTTYSNTGLTPNTTYRYLVTVYKNSSGCSGGRWALDSNIVEMTTTIAPPSGLSATPINTTQINLTWTDNSSTEDGFKIYRCSGVNCSDYTLIATKPANTTNHSDTTVCKNTVYRYKISAYKTSDWETGFSNEVTVITPDVATPQKPSLTVLNHESIKLNWVDSYTDETGFTLKTCSGGLCTEENISANLVEFTKTGLNRYTEYCFSIKAYKNATCNWETAYSSESCTRTLLEAPLAINAVALSSRKVKVTWLNPNADVDGFEIEVLLWNGKWTKAGRVFGNTIEFIDRTGVQPSATYTYRIKAFKGDSYSLPSNEVTVTTPSWSSGDDVCE